jgi:hypothetical protein
MKEQNELLEAALKLVESIKPYSLSEEERALIEVIEQHRPKPKRLEGWINLYNGYKPGGIIWPTEQEAKQNCNSDGRQVHIREVVPVEWEPWTVQTLVDFPMQTLVDLPTQTLVDSPNYQAIIDAHNSEMERVTK